MVFDFGYRLRELRVRKRLTQTQVAYRLNLSKTTISGYENNVKTPSLDIFVQLCLLYDVSADYLLGLDHRESIIVDGITERQRKILNSLLQEFLSQ
ncbi:MAG: helix-turn-helix transcriptional regulator [Clostridiales bacterium]|jgi:transcriptional regulator with XRE-family HTH domain|nr:helix-turn-helix transcriptional regulator [Clostridiales bacterium]